MVVVVGPACHGQDPILIGDAGQGFVEIGGFPAGDDDALRPADEEFLNNHSVIFATKRGQVKKTSLEQYSRPRTNGINAITINDGDQLLEVKLTNGSSASRCRTATVNA